MKRKIAYSSVCRVKKRFDNKESAVKRTEEIKSESGNILHAYKCNVCTGWHLTSKTPEERNKIKKNIDKVQKLHDKQYEYQIQQEAEYWIRKKGWKID